MSITDKVVLGDGMVVVTRKQARHELKEEGQKDKCMNV